MREVPSVGSIYFHKLGDFDSQSPISCRTLGVLDQLFFHNLRSNTNECSWAVCVCLVWGPVLHQKLNR